MSESESMEQQLIAEIVREANAARRAEAAAARHTERVKELLPQLRATDVKKYGPGRLEELIGKLLERGTISRLTAPAVGTSKKPASPAED